jgi:hypothetical protein
MCSHECSASHACLALQGMVCQKHALQATSAVSGSIPASQCSLCGHAAPAGGPPQPGVPHRGGVGIWRVRPTSTAAGEAGVGSDLYSSTLMHLATCWGDMYEPPVQPAPLAAYQVDPRLACQRH